MNFKHLRAKKDQIYQKRLFQTLNGNRIHGHPFLEVPLNRCVSVDMLTSHSNKENEHSLKGARFLCRSTI